MDWRHKQRAERVRNDSVLEVFDKDGKKLLWSGRLVDHSATGACFITEKTLAMGAQVHARMRIFGRGYVDITARVVRTGKKDKLNLYGIQYDSVKDVHPTGEKKSFDGYI